MKAVVAIFNEEKALVGAFSVIVQLLRLIVCSTNLRPELLVAERELLDAALPAVDVLDEVLEHGEPPRDLLLVVSQVQVSVQQPAASDDVSNSKTLKRTKLAKYKISHQQCHSSFHSTYVSE